MPSAVGGSAAATALAVSSLIRRVFADRLQGVKKGGKHAADKKAAAATSSANPDVSMADIVLRRLRELEPDAADFRPRLLRLVVEVALLQEFGQSLINTPKFQAMVDQVVSDLQTLPDLEQDIELVLNQLSQLHPPG